MNKFLFIHPKNKKITPVNDELTQKAEAIFKRAISNSDKTKGYHRCVCGACSSSNTYSISINGKRYQTHSLMVHYIRDHREEVPEEFLALLNDN